MVQINVGNSTIKKGQSQLNQTQMWHDKKKQKQTKLQTTQTNSILGTHMKTQVLFEKQYDGRMNSTEG